MSAIDQIRYCMTDDNLDWNDRKYAVHSAMISDTNYIMDILEQNFTVLAHRELAQAFKDGDWCELGRVVNELIEDVIEDEVLNIVGDPE